MELGDRLHFFCNSVTLFIRDGTCLPFRVTLILANSLGKVQLYSKYYYKYCSCKINLWKKVKVLVCLTFCGPMNSSSPGFSVHEILQAGILDWVPFPSPDWGIEPVSLLFPACACGFFTTEPLGPVVKWCRWLAYIHTESLTYREEKIQFKRKIIDLDMYCVRQKQLLPLD